MIWRPQGPRTDLLWLMRNHRSLVARQEANHLVNLVLDLTRDQWKPHLAIEYRQLSAAAISTQINITEGYGLGTQPLFLRHLRIAYGSAVEAGDFGRLAG